MKRSRVLMLCGAVIGVACLSWAAAAYATTQLTIASSTAIVAPGNSTTLFFGVANVDLATDGPAQTGNVRITLPAGSGLTFPAPSVTYSIQNGSGLQRTLTGCTLISNTEIDCMNTQWAQPAWPAYVSVGVTVAADVTAVAGSSYPSTLAITDTTPDASGYSAATQSGTILVANEVITPAVPEPMPLLVLGSILAVISVGVSLRKTLPRSIG